MGHHGKHIGRLCRRAALVIVLGLVAGCAEQPPPAPAAATPAVQPAPRPVVVHRRPPVAKRKPAPPSHEEPAGPAEAQPEVASAQPEIASTQAAAPVPSTSELVGLDEQRASQLLGPAAATDTRSPATVWHYKSSRCDLDLAFYMEMRTGRMRTLHYDFKRGAETPEQRQACLKAIIQENRREPS